MQYKDTFLVAGGDINPNVIMYDPAADSWAEVAALPQVRSSATAILVKASLFPDCSE